MRRVALGVLAASLVFVATATAGKGDGGPEKVPNRPGQSTTVHPPTSSEDPGAPPAADEDVPAFTPSVFLGGGAGGAQLVSVASTRDRSRLRLGGELLVPCDGGARAYAFPVAPDVPAAADGSFSGEVPHADEGPGGRQEGTWSFSGRLREGDPASGVARLVFTLTLESGESRRCDTGKLRWVARDPGSRPGVGDAKRRATYYGLTQQKRPIVFRLDSKGTGIASVAAGYEFGAGRCSASAGGTALPVELSKLKVTRRRFKSTQTMSFATDSRTVKLTVSIAARFGRARVTGSLRVVQDVIENGTRVERCETGGLKWQAER
jgi:hypothetical protein